MQIVEMMILPLIISSVVSGILTLLRFPNKIISALAQVRARDAQRMGTIAVLYYLTTTFLATIVSSTSS